jgi:endonuclease YncB( thermonuclease family)
VRYLKDMMRWRSFALRVILLAGLSLGAGCDLALFKAKPPPPPPPPTPVVVTLHSASATGDLTRVEELVGRGEDVNAVDAEGLTPLHLAALNGHAAVVRYLVSRQARPDLPDQYGGTPLHLAARGGHLDTVQALVEGGAPLEARDRNGQTAQQLAVFMQHAAVADYLAAALAPAPVVAPDMPPEVTPTLWLTGAAFRVWTSASGAQVEAEFAQAIFDTVVLRKHDGDYVRIALNLLKPEDQVLARELAGRAPPALVRTRAARGEKAGPSDSIGLHVGREPGWTVLEGCTLLRGSANDGDSFHVRHEGKEYIFRLYYVDAAETSKTYPDRVRDQARYFRLDDDDTIRLGGEARKFTERVLGAAPFTVVTKWEDARGNSQLPRHYAFVSTPQGDLDELLMAEGLVRLYGMYVESGWGGRKQSALKRLESDAKREGTGAWGLGKREASARTDEAPRE